MIELTKEQLDKFPPELHSVARRHGVDLTNFALVIAGTNRACDELLHLGERFQVARAASIVVLNNMSSMAESIVKLRGWNMDTVIECIQDIGRAQALTAGRPRDLIH